LTMDHHEQCQALPPAIDAPPQIVVVQHFDEELKRLVPTR